MAKVRKISSDAGTHARWRFTCPGCRRGHAPAVLNPGGPVWGFNGDVDRPTFTPSILVTYEGADTGHGDAPPERCHSFVREGMIQFLGDCTHALAGQTVPLPDIED